MLFQLKLTQYALTSRCGTSALLPLWQGVVIVVVNSLATSVGSVPLAVSPIQFSLFILTRILLNFAATLTVAAAFMQHTKLRRKLVSGWQRDSQTYNKLSS